MTNFIVALMFLFLQPFLIVALWHLVPTIVSLYRAAIQTSTLTLVVSIQFPFLLTLLLWIVHAVHFAQKIS